MDEATLTRDRLTVVAQRKDDQMTTPTGQDVAQAIKARLILYFAGAMALLVVSMLLVCGCGASHDSDLIDDTSDADADSDVDSDSDTDSYTDSGSDSGSIDRCADSCVNGTCDCGEDSVTCPVDCPVAWTGCAEPHDARTCDEVCSRSPTLFCVEACPSTQELVGDPLLGFESCDDQLGYPYHVGSCGEAFVGPAEWVHCCCGREAE